MNQMVSSKDSAMDAIEKVLMEGDLSKLTPELRVRYYKETCDSMKLNPLTRPFEYIRLNGKLTLYATKSCTEQLRLLHGISITKLETKAEENLYIVVASASDKEGRTDAATGVVCIQGLRGEQLANAFMKAETKAKRRVTLSLAGLGMVDESEIDSIKDARVVRINESGIIEQEISSPQIEFNAQELLNGYCKDMMNADDFNETKQIFGTGWKALENHPERQAELKACYDALKNGYTTEESGKE